MSDARRVRINLDLMPESTKEEHCRVLYRCIRDYFLNMTPEQREHYERWCEEYDRKHGLTDADSDVKGGDGCEQEQENADSDRTADKEGAPQRD